MSPGLYALTMKKSPFKLRSRLLSEAGVERRLLVRFSLPSDQLCQEGDLDKQGGGRTDGPTEEEED